MANLNDNQFNEMMSRAVPQHEEHRMEKRATLSALPPEMVKKDTEGSYVRFKTHNGQWTHIWDGGKQMDHYYSGGRSGDGLLSYDHSSSVEGMAVSKNGVEQHAIRAINKMYPKSK